jgi:hypothetical protein
LGVKQIVNRGAMIVLIKRKSASAAQLVRALPAAADVPRGRDAVPDRMRYRRTTEDVYVWVSAA